MPCGGDLTVTMCCSIDWKSDSSHDGIGDQINDFQPFDLLARYGTDAVEGNPWGTCPC
jgi:hypothetical protein